MPWFAMNAKMWMLGMTSRRFKDEFFDFIGLAPRKNRQPNMETKSSQGIDMEFEDYFKRVISSKFLGHKEFVIYHRCIRN